MFYALAAYYLFLTIALLACGALAVLYVRDWVRQRRQKRIGFYVSPFLLLAEPEEPRKNRRVE
jgi:hypothetical protein